MKKAVKLTEKQAQRIRSLAANGVEYVHINDEETEQLMGLVQTITEQRVPKDAILVENADVRYVSVYQCPTCHNRVLGTISEFCYHCGQALSYGKGGGADEEKEF